MSKLDGAWLCKLEGYPDVSTDDLTLDELDMAERACGLPYSLMDPHAGAKIAKALFAVMLYRAKLDAGLPTAQAEEEAVAAAGKVTTRRLHGAFTYVPATHPAPATSRGGTQDPPR